MQYESIITHHHGSPSRREGRRTTTRAAHRLVRALLISDIHDDLGAVSDISAWLQRQPQKTDFILFSGDLSEQEASAITMLRALSVHAPIYFVPGNHDPLSFFNGSSVVQHAGARVHNVHGRLARLAPGLWIYGWGGSTSAHHADSTSTWPGWPFDERTVAQAYANLTQALDYESSGHAGPAADDTLVLMPHCGPTGTGTVVVSSPFGNDLDAPGVLPPARIIDSGSTSTRAFLSTPLAQRRVAVVIHGHTHAGVGAARLGRLPIINPGSLRFGRRFGIITLARPAASRGQWRISTVEHLDLGGACVRGRGGCGDGDDAIAPAHSIVLNQPLGVLLLLLVLLPWVALLVACWRSCRKAGRDEDGGGVCGGSTRRAENYPRALDARWAHGV